MKLSIILVSYDMAREIPRTLQGLARDYQHGARDLEYEVILVDNGSPTPLDEASWRGTDVPVRVIRLDNASPSPAQAINIAAGEASGELLCLMVDGAHLLTPGVFSLAQSCFAAFDKPVVAVRYFYLGPDEQNVSITNGYDKTVEDQLLASVNWPDDGYRLFEIGSPLRAGAHHITWFNRMFESNCLFIRSSFFQEIGGADERFDLPGGGFLNLDIYKRAIDSPGAIPVQLIGEGSFHQLHGGTTTNVGQEKQNTRLATYLEQYKSIRGHGELMSDKTLHFLGHLPTTASKIHLRKYLG
ncbi:MAG: glycosyltransferase [Halieaceae bacterium]|jgi:glycosyltransferase involved in cell wall biosynthesis|nr:glycosyltransferase [Halieaceae bacterium]